MAHTEMDLRERRLIEDMLVAKVPVSRIAAEIGRHRSTIYREIKRNSYVDEELPYLNDYYCVTAQRYASARRARRRKLIRLPKLRAAVIDRLKEGPLSAFAWQTPAGQRVSRTDRRPSRVRRPRCRYQPRNDLCPCLQPRRSVRRAGAVSAKPSQETQTALCQTPARPCFPAGSVDPRAPRPREDPRDVRRMGG